MESNKTILVVEDDKRVNEIICDYLELNHFQVIPAYDGAQALSQFENHHIDVVILDIMMPNVDGWSVCRRIRMNSNVLIIMLSARSEEDDKLMGFDLGADEYVTKPFSPKVLVARVKALLKRCDIQPSSPAPSILKKNEVEINKESYMVKVFGEKVNLTAKEYELLLKLVENEGVVFKRDTLIHELWGYDYIGDGRVIDTNIKTLRKKLGSCARYIQTYIGVGYKFEVTP
ncbi:response regulator transcription factor [Longirhabdus pacifica]|uniref:response regulator transcription factor n=1 Tax=Longirhabdus pacifica TaxID=2305227 RepID=UPI001008A5B7|nr:response regulator transcription factor [Longirhabdus pacifica]